jgi:hypothetical protein
MKQSFSIVKGVITMKKIRILLMLCLALPLSAFANGTTDVVLKSGVESMALAEPC